MQVTREITTAGIPAESTYLEEAAERPAAGYLRGDLGVEPGGEDVGFFDDDVPAAFSGAVIQYSNFFGSQIGQYKETIG